MNNSSFLVDRLGRKHNYLRISLTERCNLRCFYCMPEDGIQLRDKMEFMSAEETVKIAQKFVNLGVNKIRLTGGEPLIKKNFSLIINELSKLNVELALTTNGVLIDKYITELQECGIKKINISLDSLKEDRFNWISRRNYFKRIMDNILLLIDNDFRVKINVVVIKGVNDDEIVDFVLWTQNLPIQVRFIEFMPFDGNNWNWEKKISEKEILNTIANYFTKKNELVKLKSNPNDTTRNFKINGFIGSFGIISSVTNPFCDTCNRIRLTADGKIKNCLFSQNETDLLTALRKELPIENLIKNCLLNKKPERGGIKSFQDLASVDMIRKNRSMTTIGG